MYPLIFGRSRVFREEIVGVTDAIQDWSGKGEVIPYDENKHVGSDPGQPQHQIGMRLKKFWSTNYQWLPANFSVLADNSVKCRSYINNLHPVKHSDIYKLIEDLISRAIPLWEQCLQELNQNIEDYFELTTGRGDTRFNLTNDRHGGPWYVLQFPSYFIF